MHALPEFLVTQRRFANWLHSRVAFGKPGRQPRLTDVVTCPLTKSDIQSTAQYFADASACPSEADLKAHCGGEVNVLVAWVASEPVGIGYIHWLCPRHAELTRQWAGTPEIFRLYVRAEFRSRNVGTHIVQQLERAAHHAGYSQVGLGVHVRNSRARKLYMRLGYLDVATSFSDRYTTVDAKGHPREIQEPSVFLVKNVDGSDFTEPVR